MAISNCQRRHSQRTALAWAVALALVIQAIAVGFATGAMAEGFSGSVFGAVCTSDKSAQNKSNSGAPNSHVDLCCVLHLSAAIETDIAREPVKTSPAEQPPILATPVFRIDAVHRAPELRPVCSRAPPARIV